MRKQKTFWVILLCVSLLFLVRTIQKNQPDCLQCKLTELGIGELSFFTDWKQATDPNKPRELLGTTDLWFLKPGDERWWIHGGNKRLCPRKLLKNGTRTMKLLFLIPSVAKNFNARDTVRTTWASPLFLKTIPEMSTISTVFLFVIGDSPRDLKLRLANEQKLFQDILRVDFSDTYHNLTLKIQFAFHWAVSHCGHFDYVIKIDDDVYMNMHLFLEMVLGLHPKEPVFGGKCYLSAKPNRDPRNKWFLSPKLFKGRFLPPLCLGPMYFMSMDVVNAIYREFSYVQRLWLEDVYIGLCAQRASIIPNKNLTEQVVNWLPDKNPTIRYPTKVIAVHFSGFYPAIVHFHVMIETALAKNKFVRKFKILGRSRMRPESWRFEVT